jgi:hypothetical protein
MWKTFSKTRKGGTRQSQTIRSSKGSKFTTSTGNKAYRRAQSIDGNKTIIRETMNYGNGFRKIRTKTVNAGANWKVKPGIKSPKAKVRKLTQKQRKNERTIIKWMFYIIIVGYIISIILN